MTTADPSSIRDALDKLDHANDAHWTADGKPAMKAIEEQLTGKSVTRADVDAAAPGFVRVTNGEEGATANELAFTALSAFDSVMGVGDGFTRSDLDLAAQAKDGAEFWTGWLKAHDPDKLHKRPFHMLSHEQQARIAVFVAVAKA